MQVCHRVIQRLSRFALCPSFEGTPTRTRPLARLGFVAGRQVDVLVRRRNERSVSQ